MNQAFVNLIILPFFIFLIRIVDVSLGTVRLIFISRGIRVASAFIGFFEVLVWLFAVGQIIQNLNSPVHYIAYAAGFGMGNFVGVSIEKKLSYGHRIINVITQKDTSELVKNLRAAGYNITSIAGEGGTKPVKLILSVVRKNHVNKVIALINKFNPNAFYTVEDIRMIREEFSPSEIKKTRMPVVLKRFFQKKK